MKQVCYLIKSFAYKFAGRLIKNKSPSFQPCIVGKRIKNLSKKLSIDCNFVEIHGILHESLRYIIFVFRLHPSMNLRDWHWTGREEEKKK